MLKDCLFIKSCFWDNFQLYEFYLKKKIIKKSVYTERDGEKKEKEKSSPNSLSRTKYT